MAESYHKRKGEENKQWGEEAEEIAKDYLIAQGYTIREHRWRLGNTIEIDLIVQKGDEIIFVEVKSRKGDYEDAVAAVNLKKQKKMAKGANVYLRALPHLFYYRMDVIAVTGSKESYTIEHIEDAFLAPFGK